MSDTETTVREALEALPDPRPPGALWVRIERDLRRTSTRHPRGPRWVVAAGVAALALGAVLLGGRAAREVDADRFDSLIAESKGLEQRVAGPNLTATTTGRVLVLRMTELDAELADALLEGRDTSRSVGLLEQRVALLRALADLDDRAPTSRLQSSRPAVY